MSLAEGVAARVAFKAYATGVITSNAQPVSTTDPAVTGGQILRRVQSTFKLGKDTYSSNEIRSDRQISDFRHGIKRGSGSLSGEFSPQTYGDLFQAAARGTWAAAITASQSDFTSVSASNSTSKFTFSAGNPLTKGFRVGMIVRFTNLSDADNNSKNFVILAMGGTTGREWTVYPAPDTMTADSAFTVASIGKSLTVPSSSFVQRKFAFEHYHEGIDMALLFTECRVAGWNLQLPATGLATVDFPMMGRDMEVYTGASAPFFTGPTAETTTGIFAAVNGLLRVADTTIGVVTGLNISMNLSPSSDAVVGQNFVPEVFLGRANVSGQFTAQLEDGTFLNQFKNETEINILAYLTTTSDIAAPAVTILLPRVKLVDADNPLQGEGAQIITCPFQALKSTAVEATTGIPATTVQICDSQIT